MMYLLLPIPFSIYACYTDMKSRKIKNYLTYPLILIGILANIYLYGLEGFKGSLLGIFIIVIGSSLLPMFALGGGDLKLAMAYGAFLTQEKALYLLFYFLLFTVIGNISVMIKKDGFNAFLTELKYEITSMGLYQARFEGIIGAPFLLSGYIITIIFN